MYCFSLREEISTRTGSGPTKASRELRGAPVTYSSELNCFSRDLMGIAGDGWTAGDPLEKLDPS